ncbi:MAG: fatty acyl-AMP ligase [Acidobacteria bacterium]|nr:fatty acyl-AMP ligase [Acidobacteriota bacterium]MCA1651700.1 fatty acyl-AMP ligase [Acidobacteriota bacterium]
MRSLIDQLQARATVQGTQLAYAFLDDGEREGERLTWNDVERRSRSIAAALQSEFLPGARVLLLFPPGLDFIPGFFGCLYAAMIAVPAYPPSGGRMDRTVGRLRGMVSDAGVTAVLTTRAVLARRDAVVSIVPALESATWLATDDINDALAKQWRQPLAGRHTVAFVQYTSGSTSEPRGVIVTHGNLLHNLACAARAGDLDRSTVSVSWLPVNHDMGLIQGVVQPSFSGFPAYLMSPAAFLQRPGRWLEAMSRLKATCSGAPNFAYDLCVRKIAVEQRRSFDLRTWRIAFNGSEPLKRKTLEAFQEAFAGSGFRWSSFRPAYGLAEATLLVSTGEADSGPSLSSGTAVDDTTILIVHPESHTPCPEGDEGEIWVSGPSVAAGYWQRAAETSHTFAARLADGKGPFLRTGDLGVLRGGRLYVSGRIKDLLIVRGMKHHPQDVEATVEATVDSVRSGCCAAFAITEAEGERVVLAAEVDPRYEAALTGGTIADIRQAVAETHGIQLDDVVLLHPGTIPKTTSGKLQRYACRAALLAGVLEPLERWTRTPIATGLPTGLAEAVL